MRKEVSVARAVAELIERPARELGDELNSARKVVGRFQSDIAEGRSVPGSARVRCPAPICRIGERRRGWPSASRRSGTASASSERGEGPPTPGIRVAGHLPHPWVEGVAAVGVVTAGRLSWRAWLAKQRWARCTRMAGRRRSATRKRPAWISEMLARPPANRDPRRLIRSSR